jgi:hypothetical protein
MRLWGRKIMLGSMVYYKLTTEDAAQINRRRTTGLAIANRMAVSEWPLGAQAHIGNEARVGQIFPMMITRVGDGAAKMVSGQIFLDGTDVLWVQDIHRGQYFGQWWTSDLTQY